MAIHQTSDKKDGMTLIRLTVIEGVFPAFLVAEVASRDRGAGGRPLTADSWSACAQFGVDQP